MHFYLNTLTLVLGGCAHLLNFTGTDTMSAAYYAQFVWNDGKPVAESIPATEHSVMTSWPNEQQAIENMIDKFGAPGKLFSVVMDSYDFTHALNVVFPSVVDKLKRSGATLVLRPDSGDPPTVVLEALRAADKYMGSRVNKLGYKVLNQTAVIQGDGISYNMLCKYDTTHTKHAHIKHTHTRTLNTLNTQKYQTIRTADSLFHDYYTQHNI
jgi:nicotinic acid phosphoribosyltransferase